ncbi:hypothetical protein [Clostridium sporogenes]|uniref:hypothetical protein n=1 Tax=Clostridium sporogenes TaxID=1509 RepID=UPI002238DFB5|nr:hypothetical protein [Clostridium sporogenes]MCW6112419.1 hypothetical protein [Clostridium sporogenes]
MIDLDKYINRTIDFKINGNLVKVQELTPKMFKKVSEYETINENEIFDKQLDLVTEILNRNTSGVKFKRNELEELPQSVINKIYTEVVNFTREPLKDPN